MYNSRLPEESVSRLADAFLSLNSREECYMLFEDLFTIREVQDLARRLDVAIMLRNKVTYTDIVAKTGVSTATIGRVNRSIVYGAGGYDCVLDRLSDTEEPKA
ncbi:MAG: YerC/YecD family TrpR-related protein [Clostridia bacterium]|nr:YerC/YecD family TrpR-related protein [Clostridia bacterium]